MLFDDITLPNGETTKLNKLEKIYLVAMDRTTRHDMIFCMFGKPSAPVYQPIVDAEIEYWSNISRTHAIEYGDLQGDLKHREKMAFALKKSMVTIQTTMQMISFLLLMAE